MTPGPKTRGDFPYKILAGLLIAALAVVFVGFCGKNCEVTSADAYPEHSVEEVAAAMVSLCAGSYAHPVTSDVNYRLTVARAIHDAAQATANPPLFLTAVFFRESSLRMSAVGKLGEVGLGQVGKQGAEKCRAENLNLDTPDGQALCAARKLASCRAACGGSLVRGFTLYATGRTCDADSEAVKRIVRNRFTLWESLEAAASGGNS